MKEWTTILFAGALTIISAKYQEYPDLQGPYCSRTRCCDGRQDSCDAPVLGSLCYCDEFCDREENDDCCPDYWTHCKNRPPSPIIPAPIWGCTFNGRVYPQGKVIKNNCNDCKCEGNSTELLCTREECLIDPKIVENVNRFGDYGWRAANYSDFWGRKLKEGLTLRLGTLLPQRAIKDLPIRFIYDPASLPREFYAENAWPRWIGGVEDQGWCGASWAISTAAVASDRFAIQSKGRENVKLSAQHLVSCNNRRQQGCNGGYLDNAWNFFRKFGLVDAPCYPYTGTNERCRLKRRGDLNDANCALPLNVDRISRYEVSPAYHIGNETDIMYEIQHSGPVQATMKVYHDFFSYRNGIYKHTPLSLLDRTGYHSVRIVGWGEENTPQGPQKFWKVANSWGQNWGEEGYFRIVRGVNECEIESFVLGTLATVENKLLLGNEIRNNGR